MADHTILVAGASGELGRRIAPALLDRGARPRLLVWGGSDGPKAGTLVPLLERGAVAAKGDLRDPRPCRRRWRASTRSSPRFKAAPT